MPAAHIHSPFLGKAEDPSRANFTVLNQSGVPTHARAMPGRRHAQRLRVTVLRWACGPRRRPLSPDSGTPRGTERCATAAARLTMAPTVLGQWGGALHRAMCHSGVVRPTRAATQHPLSSGSGTPRGYGPRYGYTKLRESCSEYVLFTWCEFTHFTQCKITKFVLISVRPGFTSSTGACLQPGVAHVQKTRPW